AATTSSGVTPRKLPRRVNSKFSTVRANIGTPAGTFKTLLPATDRLTHTGSPRAARCLNRARVREGRPSPAGTHRRAVRRPVHQAALLGGATVGDGTVRRHLATLHVDAERTGDLPMEAWRRGQEEQGLPEDILGAEPIREGRDRTR